MSKKRKISSLNSVELSLAYQSLLKLKSTFIYDDGDKGPGDPAAEIFEQEIDAVISLMGSRLEGDQPESLSFSSVTVKELTQMNITEAATFYITLKPNLEERLAVSSSLGKDELWLSQNMYRHLSWLENLIPRTTEVASARAWIDTFFFRTSAMLASPKRMLLNMEQAVPATTINPSTLATFSGYVNYTALLVTTGNTAKVFMANSTLNALRSSRVHSPSGFFVTEAKAGTSNLLEHIPQAVSEIYACGKYFNKKVLRGALTNGRQWMFILVNFNENYNGATYMYSQMIELQITRDESGRVVIPKPEPDLIAGILLNWIEKSFDGFRDDDWFE